MKKPIEIDQYRESDAKGGNPRLLQPASGLSSLASLIENRQVLQAVIDAVPAIINIKDTDYRYVLMNRFQARLYGVEPHEAVNRSASDLIGDAHGAYTEALDRMVIETGGPSRFFEEEFSDAHGVDRTLLTIKVPLSNGNGTAVGIVTVSLDISRRKDTEQALRRSEAKAQETMTLLVNAIESMNDGFILTDETNRLVICNQRFRDMYPEIEDRLSPGNYMDDVVVNSALRTGGLLTADPPERLASEPALPGSGRSMVESLSGDRWVETHDQVTPDGHRVGIHIDVTERKVAEQALATSEQRYRSLFEAAPISMWEGDWSEVKKFIEELTNNDSKKLSTIFDEQADRLVEAASKVKVLDVNEATLKLYGARDKVAFIRQHQKRLCKAPWATFRDQVQALADGRMRVVTESADARLNGERFHVRVTLELPDAHGDDWRRVFAAVEDITEARALSRELRHQAAHDQLTGLVNRREFEARLEQALVSAEDDHVEHALCYMDLDQFKIINDTSGHAAGDELLRRLGQLLAEQVRREDTLARLGGDEFGVLLENCSMQVALDVANAFRRTIEGFRFVWEKQISKVGVSIGVVPIRGGGQTVSDILSAADAACYSAKNRGRNRVHVYREKDEDVARRHGEMRWVTRIHNALDEGRFELVRQRIVPVNSAEEDGLHYEVLLRMQDENGELVEPEVFLPAAERYDLSTEIDRWVVREAFDQLSSDPTHLEQLKCCSINLSGLSLSDEDFLIFVTTEIAEHQLPPQKICFEITETAAIADLIGATRFIDALRRIGCRFALDDFGSGLSSFAYLKSLPVEYLKIDGIFVKNIVDDPINRELVRSINQIGHVMGKKTIAEFVEDDATLAALRDIGVDYAQGFAIDKPQSVAHTSRRARRTP